MRAPSSEVEASQRYEEALRRPNLDAVTQAMLAYADTLPSGEKRERILTAAAVLDVGLRHGEDISDDEREGWLKSIRQ